MFDTFIQNVFKAIMDNLMLFDNVFCLCFPFVKIIENYTETPE